MSNQGTTPEEATKQESESTIQEIEVTEQQLTQQLDYTTLVKLVQQFGSILVAIGTVISLGGYVVVHSYLWLITDLQPYSILPSQYLIAGTGILIFAAILVSLLWIAFRANIILMIVFSFGVLLILIILSTRSDSTIAEAFLTLLAPLIWLGFGINVLRLIYPRLPNFLKRFIPSLNIWGFFVKTLIQPMNGLVFLTTLIIYTIILGSFYGVYIYKDMPRSFGGGLYSSVSLILEKPDDWQALDIVDANNVYKTVTLCLVTELENDYIFIDPSKNLTFTVPRSAVLSIIDIDDEEICRVSITIPSPTPQVTPIP